MNRNKKDGTQWETKIVQILTDAGHQAHRMAEQGQNDPGDILLQDHQHGDTWYIEAKSTQNLNIHQTVHKTEQKAEKHGIILTAVIWRRRIKKQPDQRNRQPAGPPIVAMTIPTYLALLKGDG